MAQPSPSATDLSSWRETVRAFEWPDDEAGKAARARQGELTKPAGSLGRLEDLAVWLSVWQGRHPPRLEKVQALVFAANHGVADKGVSAYPASVTAQMVANFAAGGAAINQICGAFDIDLSVIDCGVGEPSADFTEQPAMTEEDCAGALKRGFDAVPPEADLLCVGEMGIANTTVAATLSAALFGGAAADWVGPGTGVDDAGIARKCAAVEQALARHGAALDDPLAALAALGGKEIAAMAGAIVAARTHRTPVLIDGYVASAAAAVLFRLDEGALDHCMGAHRSAEPAHAKLLGRVGKAPLLDLGMRLGEATGAALAVALLRAAVATHNGMATFAEAGVSEKD